MRFPFNSKISLVVLGSVSLSLLADTVEAVQTVDSGIPEYQITSGVAGTLSSVGSDTLANLMTLWAEAFKQDYPNATIQIQAAGSSTAPPALVEATANFGTMSRAMKVNELDAFAKKYGYRPTAVPVAIDALALYVNKDNPIKELTLPEVDAIMSSTRKCGYRNAITTWGQVGLTGSWQDKSIQLYGRNSVSGTYGYFKERALCKGDFKNTVNEQPGSASVVQAVSTSINGIGYSGIGYKTSGVKALPLAVDKGRPFVEPTPQHAIAGTYPLTRFLYIYVNKKPNNPLPPLELEFLKRVLSRTGQQIVIKDGYIALTAKIVQSARAVIQSP